MLSYEQKPPTIITPALERLRKKLAEMEQKKSDLLYRQHRITDAGAMQTKIDKVKVDIKELEQYEPKRLSELVPKKKLKERGLADLIIMTHIAADFFNNTVFSLRSELRKLDLEGCSLFPLADELTKKSSQYAALVCTPEFHGLSSFMVTNDKLIDDLTAICRCYLHEHLNIT